VLLRVRDKLSAGLHCPYGCVELNSKRNKQRAKSRYRKKQQAKLLASGYNRAYRVRKQNGCVFELPEIAEIKEELQRKITAQIKYFYRKLNPGAEPGKLKQLESILWKISHRMSSTAT